MPLQLASRLVFYSYKGRKGHTIQRIIITHDHKKEAIKAECKKYIGV